MTVVISLSSKQSFLFLDEVDCVKNESKTIDNVLENDLSLTPLHLRFFEGYFIVFKTIIFE